MPHALVNVIRAGAGAQLGSIAADNVVPLLRLQVPYRTGEEAGGDEVEEARRDDEEHLHLGRGAAPKWCELVLSIREGRAGEFERAT